MIEQNVHKPCGGKKTEVQISQKQEYKDKIALNGEQGRDFLVDYKHINFQAQTIEKLRSHGVPYQSEEDTC